MNNHSKKLMILSSAAGVVLVLWIISERDDKREPLDRGMPPQPIQVVKNENQRLPVPAISFQNASKQVGETAGKQDREMRFMTADSIFQEIEVPDGWLDKQSLFIKEAVKKRCFVFNDDAILGVMDENERFVTWPAAPHFVK